MFSFSSITSVATPVLGKVALGLKKYSPEIGLGLGIVGNVLAIGMACRATLELDKVKAESQKEFDRLEEEKENCAPGAYTEEMHQKDLAVLSLRRTLAITKLYLPAAGLELASLILIFGSYRTLSIRNAGLAAAYEALSVGFKKYRGRVVEELGPDKDREFRFGKEAIDAENKLNDENLPWEEKKEISENAPTKFDKDGYIKWFAKDTSTRFQNQGEFNYFFLTSQEKLANMRLQTRGHVFLNEVFQDIGMPITETGNVVGWYKDHGDNYIDFGLTKKGNQSAQDALNNTNHGPILMEFNVDGPILKHFPKK